MGLLGQTDVQLNQLIQPPIAVPPADSRLAELQKRLPAIDRELVRTGVTRYDQWIDYRGQQPNGYQYTQFCPATRWNPASFIRWAGRIGAQTQHAVEVILGSN